MAFDSVACEGMAGSFGGAAFPCYQVYHLWVGGFLAFGGGVRDQGALSLFDRVPGICVCAHAACCEGTELS